MIYFQADEQGSIRFGHSDQVAKRHRAHANDGLRLAAARPGTGKGSETDEEKIHTFFKDDHIPGRGPSWYRSDRMWNYIDWLLIRGYAARTYDDADRLPSLPFDIWRPEKTGDAFTEDSGQGILVPGFETRLERTAYAHQLVHLMSKSDQWLTPPHVIDRARRALGGSITTDPASCHQANIWIRAQTWYSIDFDGLHPDYPWHGTVWLNPPYGRGDHSAGAFTTRLVAELKAGTVSSAITCLNLNSSSSLWFDTVWDHAAVHLIWRGRIDFIKPAEDEDSSPSKGTILSYFGPNPDAFCREFDPVGELFERKRIHPM